MTAPDMRERLARMEKLALALTQEIASLRAEIDGGTLLDARGYPKASPTSIGHAITVARTRQGIKRPALAILAEISYPYMAEIETGRKTAPMTTLQRIADALDTPLSELLAVTA